MAGSRGMWIDEPKRLRRETRSPDERRENHRPRQGRTPGVVEPMVNTRPAQDRPQKMLNPVLTRPIEVKSRNPRMTGVIEYWNQRGFGFIVDPATGEQFYMHATNVSFDPTTIEQGLSVEFTGAKDGDRTHGKAFDVTMAEKPLAREIVTHVVIVRERCCYLSNPDTNGARGTNILATNQVLSNPIMQQDVRALVITTPKGMKAVKVTPL